MIASLLLLVILLALASLPLHVAWNTRSLGAQEQADLALENVLEGVRSGQIPLHDGPVTPFAGPLSLQFEHAVPMADASVLLDVEDSGTPHLLVVTARIHYTVGPRHLTRALMTQVWRP